MLSSSSESSAACPRRSSGMQAGAAGWAGSKQGMNRARSLVGGVTRLLQISPSTSKAHRPCWKATGHAVGTCSASHYGPCLTKIVLPDFDADLSASGMKFWLTWTGLLHAINPNAPTHSRRANQCSPGPFLALAHGVQRSSSRRGERPLCDVTQPVFLPPVHLHYTYLRPKVTCGESSSNSLASDRRSRSG